MASQTNNLGSKPLPTIVHLTSKFFMLYFSIASVKNFGKFECGFNPFMYSYSAWGIFWVDRIKQSSLHLLSLVMSFI